MPCMRGCRLPEKERENELNPEPPTGDIIRRVLQERGELPMLDLVAACLERGVPDSDKVSNALLPLIYDGTVEFTPERNLKLRPALTVTPRFCSYCGAGTEMESFLGHGYCDEVECLLCHILDLFAAEEKLIPEKLVLCRYCLADFLTGTPHDEIVYPCDGAAPTLHSVRLREVAQKRGA